MAQTQKAHVHEGIVDAAASLFAEVGFEKATMAAVAERAGSSIGNVYKYFANKDELFAAVVPESFATELRSLTRDRIKALGNAKDIRLLPPDARYHVLAGELLDFSIANRERVIILLGRADGTPFAPFPGDFVKRLVDWAFEYAAVAWPDLTPTREMRFAMHRIYTCFLQSLAEAFATFKSPDAIREAVFHITSHHQGGLLHLFESAIAKKRSER